MPDMLVKLYDLDRWDKGAPAHGCRIRRPLPPEKHIVAAWVRKYFSEYWGSECECAFARVPVACFVAQREKTICGFSCYDVTSKGFFGPTGVAPEERGKGIGTSLLFAALRALAEQGYGYAIIGGAGPVDFYSRTVGAVLIEDSKPGIYAGLL
jgi:GNAT superfamily N-acetyltransferase